MIELICDLTASIGDFLVFILNRDRRRATRNHYLKTGEFRIKASKSKCAVIYNPVA